jgi:small subunit ribosomal protein S18
MSHDTKKKKRRFMLRRKRTLDPSTIIDYRKPDSLKRFITDRGKIIPRRISGATAEQQRQITVAVKRARYLAIIPYSVSHRPERGFAGEMAAANTSSFSGSRGPRRDGGRPPRDGAPRDGARDSRPASSDSRPASTEAKSAAPKATEEKKGE